MVKVNELRIGNFLDTGHEVVHVTSISLDIDDEYNPTIGTCKYGEHKKEVIINEAAFGIEVKPIPLTPEWLERCGFKDIGSCWFHRGEPSFGLLKDNEGGLYIGNPVRTYVKTVHQLQNLYFALTEGEELNVKL